MLADQVLYSGIACIVDLIVKEGLINLDFADVRTVMSGMGTAMMGTGEASGERPRRRAPPRRRSPTRCSTTSRCKGAKGLLLSIIGGRDLTLYEVDEAASRVRQEVDPEANIIVGATFDDALGDRVRVSIVASGMTAGGGPGAGAAPQQAACASGLARAVPRIRRSIRRAAPRHWRRAGMPIADSPSSVCSDAMRPPAAVHSAADRRFACRACRA